MLSLLRSFLRSFSRSLLRALGAFVRKLSNIRRCGEKEKGSPAAMSTAQFRVSQRYRTDLAVVVFVMILGSLLSLLLLPYGGKTLIAYRVPSVLFSHALVIQAHMAHTETRIFLPLFFFFLNHVIDIAASVCAVYFAFVMYEAA